MKECCGEFLGTFILVFFGTGAVHTAVLTGAQVGLGQVAAVWGAAVTLGIYAAARLSGAHLNPAVTVACAASCGFPWRKAPGYVAAQLAGAFAASATLYALFHGVLARFEQTHALVRGAPGSELSAMCYGEYFPDPALFGSSAAGAAHLSVLQAMLAEGLGTFFLVLMVCVLTCRGNAMRPPERLAPPLIGLTLAMLISLFAPLTQACFNPARDLGPRLVAWLAGWGAIAIPGPRGGFFSVYILAPTLGGLAGAAVHEFAIGRQCAGALVPDDVPTEGRESHGSS